MRRLTAHDLVLVIVLAAFAFLHLYRMGSLSFTWDEAGDMAIVQCLKSTGDPFACREDITQTRFPFYLHALVSGRGHFLLSFAFSAVTLLAVHAYARREYGAPAATLFAALYVTSPAMLAGGRMVLTHSHVICTAFATLAVLALFEYNRTARRPWFYMCAVLCGLAAASSILAVFHGVVLLAFYTRRSWRDLLFLPVAAVTFFAATVVYASPANFRELVVACMAGGGKYTHWNYLGLGTIDAPWFFPFLLLLIKVGPWVAGALGSKRFAAALLAVLLLKGAVFGYETPHHQMQFYPLLYLFIAVAIARVWRRWVAVLVVTLLALQVYDVARFFPNYLFYGAQYGKRFMGEFYGPAVVHAQGRDAVLREVAKLGNVQILVADNNGFDLYGPQFVPFTRRDPGVRYEYALVDWLYAEHFRYPEREEYNRFLAERYREHYTTWFPTGKWVYRIVKVR